MKTFVGLVVAILFLTLFTVENTTPVAFKFMSFAVDIPLSLAIVIPLGVALLIFALFHFGTLEKAEVVIRDLENNVERAQKELVAATKRKHELEIENRKLKIRLGDETDTDEHSL